MRIPLDIFFVFVAMTALVAGIELSVRWQNRRFEQEAGELLVLFDRMELER